MTRATPPAIIMGMHRFGASLLTRGQQSNGIPMGRLEGDDFSLLQQYLARVVEHIAAPGECALTVRYEAFLTHSREELEWALSFCGLTPNAETVVRNAGIFRAGRAQAWRHNKELRAFATHTTEVLAHLGYPADLDETP